MLLGCVAEWRMEAIRDHRLRPLAPIRRLTPDAGLFCNRSCSPPAPRPDRAKPPPSANTPSHAHLPPPGRCAWQARGGCRRRPRRPRRQGKLCKLTVSSAASSSADDMVARSASSPYGSGRAPPAARRLPPAGTRPASPRRRRAGRRPPIRRSPPCRARIAGGSTVSPTSPSSAVLATASPGVRQLVEC